MTRPLHRCPCCRSTAMPITEHGLPCPDCIEDGHSGRPNCPACTRNLESILSIAKEMLEATSLPTTNANRKLGPSIAEAVERLKDSRQLARNRRR